MGKTILKYKLLLLLIALIISCTNNGEKEIISDLLWQKAIKIMEHNDNIIPEKTNILIEKKQNHIEKEQIHFEIKNIIDNGDFKKEFIKGLKNNQEIDLNNQYVSEELRRPIDLQSIFLNNYNSQLKISKIKDTKRINNITCSGYKIKLIRLDSNKKWIEKGIFWINIDNGNPILYEAKGKFTSPFYYNFYPFSVVETHYLYNKNNDLTEKRMIVTVKSSIFFINTEIKKTINFNDYRKIKYCYE